jgi:hypothetical protein
LSASTPAQDIKKWFLVTPVSFMPNEMDLDAITTWFTQGSQFTGQITWSWFASGKVLYNYNNIFVTKPTEACEGREIKTDTNINLNFINPKEWSTIAQKFGLWIEINGPKVIKSALVYIDDAQVAVVSFKWKETSVSQLQAIDLPKSITNWEHTLKISAVDAEWFSNEKSISINITSTDKQAPVLLEDKIKVTPVGSGYQVSLIFNDELSYLKWWSITQNEKVIKKFDWSVAIFNVDQLGLITISAEDAYGNKLSKSVDLSTYQGQ